MVEIRAVVGILALLQGELIHLLSGRVSNEYPCARLVPGLFGF